MENTEKDLINFMNEQFENYTYDKYLSQYKDYNNEELMTEEQFYSEKEQVRNAVYPKINIDADKVIKELNKIIQA